MNPYWLVVFFCALASLCRADLVVLDPDAVTDPLNNAWSGGEWDSDGQLGGWSAAGITSPTVSAGVLSGISSGNGGAISLTGITRGPDFDLGYNDFLDLRLKLPANYSGDVQLYYGVLNGGRGDGDPPGQRNLTGFDASRCFTIKNAELAKDGAFHVYRVNLSLEVWCRGQLNDLRIVPATVADTAFEIDYIRIGDTGPVPTVQGYNATDAPFSLQSKNFIFGWHQTAVDVVGMNAAWAKLNLRNAEEVFAFLAYKLKYPKPRWQEAGGPYKFNFYCVYGGNWSDTWKVMNVGYGELRTDPPSWTITHELTHGFQGRLSSGHVPGEYYELHANYGREQWLKHYQALFPNQSGFAPAILGEMHMAQPIGRNYYETWQPYLYLDTNPDNLPDVGVGTVGSSYASWREMAPGETSIYQSLKHSLTNTNVKDLIGYYARRGLNYNYPGFEPIKAKIGAIQEWEQLTEPIRRPDAPDWWQVPQQRAPMQAAYTIHELTPSGSGAGRVVSVDLRGLLAEGTGDNWRASLIVMNDAGGERYSTLFGNNQSVSVTLGADENRVFLVVAATPDDYELYRFEEPQHPYRSDYAKRRFPYEFRVTGATPKERNHGAPTGLVQHANGGGWRSTTAVVDATAFIGPNARVLNNARVLGNARVEDFAVVRNNARLQDNAIARGHAQVFDNAVMTGRASVSDYARVGGSATLSGSARLLEHATISGGAVTDQSVMKGSSGSWGGTLSGNAIADGDYSFGRNIHNASIAGHLPWVGIPDNWLVPLPPGLYASYNFSSASDGVALDTYAATNGLYRGNPSWLVSDDSRTGVLVLNGVDQWIQLERSVADLPELSLTSWVKWNGGAADQVLFQFGDGASKSIRFTPSNAAGVAELRATDGTNTYQISAATALPVGTWCQVAVSLNGTIGTFTINGAPAGSGALPLRPFEVAPPNTAANPAHHFIGRSSAGNFFNGSLDDFNVYSIASPSFLLVSVTAPEQIVPENAPSVTFRISRTSLNGSSSSGNQTIAYTVTGTAMAGADFVMPSGTAVIPDGQSHVDVEIPLILDDLQEPDETLTLVLTPSNDYANSGSGSASVTIPNIADFSDSILAWYPFNESSGTVANDISGKNQHATLINGPVWDPAQNALSFDNANDDNDYVQTPVPNGSSRTLSAWFRPESSPAIRSIFNYNAVFDSDVPGAFGAGWGVVDGKIRVMLDDTMWDTGIPVTLNQWQHGSLTFDKTRVRFYLNGVLQGSFSYSQGGITTANYTIGSKAFDGQIRDAKILNRVIYATEAMQIYQAGAPDRAPRNLIALAGHGAVTLGWQPADVGETGYVVRRATTSSGPYTDLATVTTTSFVDSSLVNGTTYYYVVAALRTQSPGPNSNEVSATPVAGTSPPPPWQHVNIGSAAGLPTTSFSGGLVNMTGAGRSITTNNGTIGGNISTDHFRFLYLPVVGDCTITARIDSLSGNPDIRAGVMLRQTTAGGSVYASALLNIASSTSRRGLFVYRTTASQRSTAGVLDSFTVAQPWLRVSRVGNVLSAFYSSDGSTWITLGTAQTISNFGNGQYLAGLAVCSSSTTSLASAVFSNVTITGGYPTGLRASAANGQVALSWNAVAGATSYRVKRATVAGGPYSLIASPTVASFNDTGLTNDTTYHYVVSSHNGTAESGNSSPVFATPTAPLASVPIGLLATDEGSSVRLNWAASSNAVSYRVKRAPTPSGPFSLVGSTGSTTFTDTSATSGTNFFYTVAAVNGGNIESGDSEVASVLRAVFFDPNGPAVGSVANGGSYSWLGTHWAVAPGGSLATGSWQPGTMAVFTATSPAAGTAYTVDMASYNTASHGAFTGIRATGGTLTFGGNAFNFYLTGPTTFTADPGAAIVFNQGQSSGWGNASAFNLNGQTATFHGDVTINSVGFGNGGTTIVGSGMLKLGQAVQDFTPAAVVLEAGTTLSNHGDAGKWFNLPSLTMNGATLAAVNAGHASWGNFVLTGGLTVGGNAASVIAADVRCNSNTNQTLNIGETGEEVDLHLTGRLGHINWIAWSYATKTGPGTLKISGVNGLGGLTVNEGTLILEGPSAIAAMDITGLTNNNATVMLSVPSGTVSYPRPLQGNGLFRKTGQGTLELTTTTVHSGQVRVEEGVLRLSQPRLGDASAIEVMAGAQLELAYSGMDTIGALTIDGTQLPPGIYDARSHPNLITGTGQLKVAASAILTWNNSAGTGIWNSNDANWTGLAWQHLADAVIAHSLDPQTITLQGSLSAVDVHVGNGSNNANYTLLGQPGAALSALAFNVQGAAANDPGLGAVTLNQINATISTNLRVGRWDLVIGGGSRVDIAGQLRSTSDGNGAGDWGRVTIQEEAAVTASGGVNGAGAAWGLTLNGGTLTTPVIRAAENGFGAGARLTLNGTTIRATQPTSTFLTVDGTNRAYLGSGGARFDTNGNDIGVGVQLVDTVGQSGTLTKLGAGMLTLTNANTFTGPVVVAGGTLYANLPNAATNRAFSAASGITVRSGATLRSSANALFGWDGSQAKPITLEAGATASADAGGDVNVGLVTLSGGTLAGGPSATWGSWTFGRAATKQLVVTENSTVSAADVSLFNGSTVDVAAGKELAFIGTIVNTSSAASALIKTGAGTVQLSGVNTYTGVTTVRSGTLDVSGSIAGGSELVVADQPGTAVLRSRGNITRSWLRFGTAAGAVGAAHQTAGSVTTTLNGGNSLGLGHVAGSYGCYRISGGNLQTQEASIGTWGNANDGGHGLLEVTGGTVNNLGWLVMNRSAGGSAPAQRAVLHVAGNSSVSYGGGGLVANWGASSNSQIAVVNVADAASITTTNNTPITFNSHWANTGVLNLNGGTVTTSQVSGSRGFVNFNGGTLRPSVDSTNFLAVNRVRVHGGGAVIDTAGRNITIGLPLAAPSGQGIVDIPVTDGGEGYTCPPIVTIGNGTENEATAVARMADDGTGRGTFRIESLTMISPGSYTGTSGTVGLTGGGATRQATFGTPVMAALSSGRLTKQGNGTLTLTAANTYGGGTAVNGGSLVLSGASASLGGGDLTVADGATCVLNNPNGAVADVATVSLGASARLELAANVAETVRFLHLNGVLQPAGTYTAANLPNHLSGAGSLVVTDGVAPLTAAELWREQHFGSTSPTGDAADQADPDLDGYPNLLERAFGLNPRGPDAQGGPQLDVTGDGMVLVFAQSLEAQDLTVVVEVCDDLRPSQWRPAVHTPAPNADGRMEVLDDVSTGRRVHRFTVTSNSDRCFYRVRVAAP